MVAAATSLFSASPSYAASAMALVRAKGKVNALPVLALVCLLWIYEVRAPRLAVYDLFAPSKPFIPLSRSILYHILADMQMTFERILSGKLRSRPENPSRITRVPNL